MSETINTTEKYVESQEYQDEIARQYKERVSKFSREQVLAVLESLNIPYLPAIDEIRSILQDEGVGRKMNMKKILWANKHALDENELKRLDLIFKKYEKYPVLKQAWIIKEQIIHMYRAASEEEARKRFDHVMMLLETPEYSRYLNTLHGTLKKWKQPILNYFKNKTTNGFTEGCHTKIKMIKRISFGFRNINNYIAKITLAFLPLVWIINYHTS